MQIIERITCEAGDRDAWVCLCGNTPTSDGFSTCDVNGRWMEPLIGSAWQGHYVCDRCGRIIEQNSLNVIGQN